MSDGAAVDTLHWDSEFWGVHAARVFVTTSDDLRNATQECSRRGVQWASLLLAASDVTTINAAVRHGFDIVDYRIAFSSKPIQTVAPFELANPSDEEAMAEIASTAFPMSRFAVDSRLDAERCSAFYETWVRNSFNGQMADATVVSRFEGSLDGFITMRCRQDGSGALPLVAVRADRRGKGVAKRLLDGAMGWMICQSAESVEVVTQVSNTSAMRLYEAGGFQVRECDVWLHRWFD